MNVGSGLRSDHLSRTPNENGISIAFFIRDCENECGGVPMPTVKGKRNDI